MNDLKKVPRGIWNGVQNPHRHISGMNLMGLECGHCSVSMTSLSDGITWCPNCGKVTSIFQPEMIPLMSKIIFDAKRSAGRNIPESKIKVIYGTPEETPKLKVLQ